MRCGQLDGSTPTAAGQLKINKLNYTIHQISATPKLLEIIMTMVMMTTKIRNMSKPDAAVVASVPFLMQFSSSFKN